MAAGFTNGSAFREMFTNAFVLLNGNAETLNELNVFPVPDGDTGTNMSLTMNAAVNALSEKNPQTLTETADVISSALLRGARGNSGVILSLLFRGFSKRMKGIRQATPAEFAEGLRNGVEAAYQAVMKPSEGTILTVARLSSDVAVSTAAEGAELEAVIAAALEEAKTALANTPRQNPVLAKAGVVDAGGKGYVYILEGYLRALRGETLTPENLPESTGKGIAAFENEDIKYTYCTEFIVTRSSGKDALPLRACLDSMGDSLVFVEDTEIIKVHVHTNNPGRALEEALLYGCLTAVKIENMREQHTERLEAMAMPAHKVAPPEKQFGFVSVCSGDGLETVFRDLGVDAICTGGQTMNPSTQDIVKAVDTVPAHTVYVFPNNRNIVLAARQAVGLSEKEIVVIPTTSVPQAVSALLLFDPEAERSENEAAMLEAIGRVTTAQMTYASRDASFDGKSIRKGDYMFLVNGKVEVTGREIDQVVKKGVGKMKLRDAGFITVFTGIDANDDATKIIADACSKETKGAADINIVYGGQPVYSYLISAE